jgi:hypothetical protein
MRIKPKRLQPGSSAAQVKSKGQVAGEVKQVFPAKALAENAMSPFYQKNSVLCLTTLPIFI